jgi:hypothetical protein
MIYGHTVQCPTESDRISQHVTVLSQALQKAVQHCTDRHPSVTSAALWTSVRLCQDCPDGSCFANECMRISWSDWTLLSPTDNCVWWGARRADVRAWNMRGESEHFWWIGSGVSVHWIFCIARRARSTSRQRLWTSERFMRKLCSKAFKRADWDFRVSKSLLSYYSKVEGIGHMCTCCGEWKQTLRFMVGSFPPNSGLGSYLA